MAKRPDAGEVNTRLVRPGFMDAATAAALAWEMLACTVRRLSTRLEVVLAVSPDGAGPELSRRLGRPDLRVVDQGGGDLGSRLGRVWRAVGLDRPLAFFGIDSPDLPGRAVEAIGPALAECDAAIGPTPDGGYWALAAGRHHPPLLRDIDWGSGSVYDQTRARAARGGVTVACLPLWPDVDRPEDVWALRERLRAGSGADTGEATNADDALRTLAHRLDELLQGTPQP
jgi:glycosyltransferase A (GT-A) superfamily protein (DUF2064 family)